MYYLDINTKIMPLFYSLECLPTRGNTSKTVYECTDMIIVVFCVALTEEKTERHHLSNGFNYISSTVKNHKMCDG